MRTGPSNKYQLPVPQDTGAPQSSNHLAELEDRQINRDDDASDDNAQDDHDHRLEQTCQCIDRFVDLALVIISDLRQH